MRSTPGGVRGCRSSPSMRMDQAIYTSQLCEEVRDACGVRGHLLASGTAGYRGAALAGLRGLQRVYRQGAAHDSGAGLPGHLGSDLGG
jgi:hypothetical protein